jgi:hypothetical protein
VFAIAHKKLEQWENNRRNKKTWQSGYNKKPEVKAKANLTYSKKKVHNPFGEARRKMPKVSNN